MRGWVVHCISIPTFTVDNNVESVFRGISLRLCSLRSTAGCCRWLGRRLRSTTRPTLPAPASPASLSTRLPMVRIGRLLLAWRPRARTHACTHRLDQSTNHPIQPINPSEGVAKATLTYAQVSGCATAENLEGGSLNGLFGATSGTVTKGLRYHLVVHFQFIENFCIYRLTTPFVCTSAAAPGGGIGVCRLSEGRGRVMLSGRAN